MKIPLAIYVTIARDTACTDLSGRDDVLSDLGWVEHPDALAALEHAARFPGQDSMLLQTIGESIADQWHRRGWYDPCTAATFVDEVRDVVDERTADTLPTDAREARPNPAYRERLYEVE